MKPSSRNGFTFIEILLGITIFSVVIAGVYFNFNVGLFLYSRTSKELNQLTNYRLVFSKIENELKNAVPYSPMLFEGDNKKINFPAVIPFYRRETIENLPMRVEYAVKGSKLVRNTTPIGGGYFQEDQKSSDTFLEGVRNFQFQFASFDPAKNLTWSPVWPPDGIDATKKAASGIPRFVKISFEYPKTNETDTEYHEVRKIVFIPQGLWGEAKLSQ